jgi:dipeptidyl aminopeptidase/acylaminoacyl peptidase
MQIQKAAFLAAIVLSCVLAALAQNKPKLTLDAFFNSVSFTALEMSPDGNSVIIGTDRSDWDQQILRDDLWLYRVDSATLIQLTQSGHDTDPEWSPDGRWIAFLSERKASAEKSGDSDSASSQKTASQVYLISPAGGEAFALTQSEEEVHAFSWSADSQTIYYATRQPWSRTQEDDYREKWKDVIEYRTAERGDAIFALNVQRAVARHAAPAIAGSRAHRYQRYTIGFLLRFAQGIDGGRHTH